MKKNLGRFYLLIVAILWGSSLTVVKSAQAVFKPNMLLAFRFSIACIILSIIFYKKIKNMTREDLKSGTIIGIVLFLAYSVQTIGVGYTDPGRSAFLSASYCVIVPFISWLVIKHKPNRFHVIAAVFCIIGIYFVSVFGESSKSVGNNAILGDGLALLSGVLFASHIVAVTKFSEGRDPILMTIIQFLVAAVLVVVMSLLFEDNFPIVFEKRAALELIYLSLMCTTIALLLQNIGQSIVDESSCALILSLESVFGILIPYCLGIEGISLYSLFGFMMIFASIIISETKLEFLKRLRI